MASDLKPCPFCGSTDLDLHQEDGRETWAVECNECLVFFWDLNRERTIHGWNTRKEPTDGR